jgi:hypothetical protein
VFKTKKQDKEFKMRRGNKAEILRNEAGLFMGVNLGADYCAEHEWGVR